MANININKDLILDMVYPVGSIYISVSTVTPDVLFGGTWERFARGRTLVGVNESETEFTTVEKTGGSKNLQAHSHATYLYYSGDAHWNQTLAKYPVAVFGSGSAVKSDSGRVDANKVTYTHSTSPSNPYKYVFSMPSHETATTGSGNSQNLQPYITVYMWKRVA